jgi:hypothetical protein
MWELRGDGWNSPDVGWMKSIATGTERNAKALNKAQHEFLDSYKNVVDHWCKRRHEGVAALMGLTMDVAEARSPTAVGTAVLRWHQGALQRLSQDAQDQLKMGLTAAQCCGAVTGALAPSPGSKDVARAAQGVGPRAKETEEKTLHS